MLVAAAQLGRYCLSINDNLPSSRRGSQSGRFQSRADRDARCATLGREALPMKRPRAGTGTARMVTARHEGPGHWEAWEHGADPGAGEGVAVAPGSASD